MATTTPGFASARNNQHQNLYIETADPSGSGKTSYGLVASANIVVNTLVANVTTANSATITVNTTTQAGAVSVTGNVTYLLEAAADLVQDSVTRPVLVQWFDVTANAAIGPVVQSGMPVSYSPTVSSKIVARAVPDTLSISQALFPYPAALDNAFITVQVIGGYTTPTTP